MARLGLYGTAFVVSVVVAQTASAQCSLALSKHPVETIVPVGYQHIATDEGVPCDLLYAIALTESGQSRFSQQQWRPWPWTLNIEGRGHYFPSRIDAWRALKKTLAANQGAADIGLLQINWRYHHRELETPWQALAPYHNLRVGAAILKRCFNTTKDWWQSAGCYHAPNHPKRAKGYQARVRRHWQKILGQAKSD